MQGQLDKLILYEKFIHKDISPCIIPLSNIKRCLMFFEIKYTERVLKCCFTARREPSQRKKITDEQCVFKSELFEDKRLTVVFSGRTQKLEKSDTAKTEKR